MIAIDTPLRSADDVAPLADAGAGSFYCGLVRAGADGVEAAISNRRPDDPANFTSPEALADAVARAHARGCPVFVTLNERFHPAAREPWIAEQVRLVRDLGADGVIVGSVATLRMAARVFPPAGIHASVCLEAGNSGSVRFLASLGAGGVIAPRHLLPDEVARIAAANPDVRLEAFVMNSRCAHHEGYCGYLHQSLDGAGGGPGACRRIADGCSPRLIRDACGVCALFDLARIPGLRAVKVVGRDLPVARILADVALVRAALDALAAAPDRDAFEAGCRDRRRAATGRDCLGECYHAPGGEPMERAVFVYSRADPERVMETVGAAIDPDDPDRADRVCFGAEACEHALPGPALLDRVVAACRDGGVAFTLVTPPCTDRGVERVARLLPRLPPGSEVVFNDWGVFELLRAREDLVRVHGRILTRAVRDPRLDPAAFGDKSREFLGSTSLHSPGYQAFLRENGVARAELDDPVQGYEPLPRGSLPVALSVPWVPVAVSRYCGGHLADACRHDACPARVSTVQGAPVLVLGTATYHPNRAAPRDLSGLGVDRIVRWIDLPGVDDPIAAPAASSAPEPRPEPEPAAEAALAAPSEPPPVAPFEPGPALAARMDAAGVRFLRGRKERVAGRVVVTVEAECLGRTVEVELSPVPLGRPHFRAVGGVAAAYRSAGADLAVVNRVLEALLPPGGAADLGDM
ncbi:MAG: U32 family peptidase [Deltaproteobacteria bacterium]|nr:U32 family peptidase [Deltaproteobacteria bacterium]